MWKIFNSDGGVAGGGAPPGGMGGTVGRQMPGQMPSAAIGGGGAVGGAQPTASQLAMAGYYALIPTPEALDPDPGCHGVVMLARLCQRIFRLPARPQMCAPVCM